MATKGFLTAVIFYDEFKKVFKANLYLADQYLHIKEDRVEPFAYIAGKTNLAVFHDVKMYAQKENLKLSEVLIML